MYKFNIACNLLSLHTFSQGPSVPENLYQSTEFIKFDRVQFVDSFMLPELTETMSLGLLLNICEQHQREIYLKQKFRTK